MSDFEALVEKAAQRTRLGSIIGARLVQIGGNLNHTKDLGGILADAILSEWPEMMAAERERIAMAIEAYLDSSDCDNDPTCELCALVRHAAAIARATTNDTGVTPTPANAAHANLAAPSTIPDDGDTP